MHFNDLAGLGYGSFIDERRGGGTQPLAWGAIAWQKILKRYIAN
jgi:hypothetical protein